MLAYASKNRYAIVGGGRNLILKLSFEFPLIVLFLIPALNNNSFLINQSFNPYNLLLFLPAFFISLLEVEMVPFDIPHAAQEIAGGWMTEYGGPFLAVINYAENIKLFLISFLLSSVFLPWNPWLMSFLVVFLLSFYSASNNRYSIDDAVRTGWTTYLPLSLLLLVLSIYFY